MGYLYYLIFLLALSLSHPHSVSVAQNLPYKAVNLGNWLVAEGWMKPSLFDGITNKDLLDGTQVQLMSTKSQRYLTAEDGGGAAVVANRDSASGWETFRLWRVSDTSFNFRVFNKQFVGLENQGGGNKLVAVSNSPSDPETFHIIRSNDDPLKIRIQASNGLFLQAICYSRHCQRLAFSELVIGGIVSLLAIQDIFRDLYKRCSINKLDNN